MARPLTPAEQEWLERYEPGEWPRPSVTVDLAVFTVRDADLKVLLVRRKELPYAGLWALPGGFVRVGPSRSDQGEDLDAAAHRELEEETGLRRGTVFLEQLRAFGAPGRDPRMRVISVAYAALVAPEQAMVVVGGSDAAEARFFSVGQELDASALAFDHEQVLSCAVQWIRRRLNDSAVACALVPETFTVAELRAVHEAVQGATHDPGNFRRRFKRMVTDGLIVQAPGRRHTGTKPARVYRFAPARGEA